MAHRSRFLAAASLVVLCLVGAALVAPAVLATKPDPEHKVTICHRTHSDANPYVMITVDIASSGHLQGGHDTEHQGPIWDETLKGQHIEWGDIIPPYAYGAFSYPGANWTEQGQAILANGCRIPEPSPEAPSASVASEEPSASVESQVPSGSVEAETGVNHPTPPPTDASGIATSPSNGGLGLALAALGALVLASLTLAPVGAGRRVVRR